MANLKKMSSCEKLFERINNVLKQQNWELVKIISEDENELGRVYEILYKPLDKSPNSETKLLEDNLECDLIVQHFSGSGITWVWGEDFQNYLQERREIKRVIELFLTLPKEQKIARSQEFAEKLVFAGYNINLVSKMIQAY
ncbi:MAG: hypothetical protein WBV73_24900 [Phormidium sp.]